MKRTLAIVAIVVAAQAGLVLTWSGVATAVPTLSGSANSSLTSGFVNFTNGLSNAPPNGNEKVEIEGQLSCTTANVLPPITSLTGVYKGVIKFKKTPNPNQARACGNFIGSVAG